MRTLEYVQVHHSDGEIVVEGTVADLLLDIPYLIAAPLIPPLRVVNEVLASGIMDAGMSGGCRWEPFRLGESEFAETVAELTRRGGKRRESLRFEAPPSWVDTRTKWVAWTAQRFRGVPIEQNLRLMTAIERSTQSLRQARAEGRRAARVWHWVSLLVLTNRSLAFLRKYASKDER